MGLALGLALELALDSAGGKLFFLSFSISRECIYFLIDMHLIVMIINVQVIKL